MTFDKAAYHKEYMKRWYANNSKRHQAYVQNRRQQYKEELDNLKMHPCMDCGFIPQVPDQMDWDHCPERGAKIDGLAKMRISTVGRNRIMNEIAKCDLVCSNCHRLRTYTRRVSSVAEQESHTLFVEGASPSLVTVV